MTDRYGQENIKRFHSAAEIEALKDAEVKQRKSMLTN